MMRITLVEIDVDDDKAAQHLDAMPDRGEAMPAAPLQYLAAMVEECLERLLQIHHPRHPRRIDDIEVERHPDFQLGQPEQLLHHHFGIDIARLRLEDEAPTSSVDLVMDIVGEQRQLFFFEQCTPTFSMRRPLGTRYGHSRVDNDLIEPVRQRSSFRQRARQAKAAAAGGIGLGDAVRWFDDGHFAPLENPGRRHARCKTL